MSYIGIDVGGTTVKIGIFDNELNLIEKISYDSNQLEGNLVENICFKLKDSLNLEEIEGVGLGLPGFILKNGYLKKLTNLKLEDYNVIDGVKKIINTHVVAGNDANMAAVAEIMYQNKVKEKNYAMITLGTGVGGGIVVNNSLLWGSRGMAAEIGHIKIDEKYLFDCGCQNQGCLETISSAIGLKNLYSYYKEDYPKSLLHQVEIDSKNIFDYSKTGDQLAKLLVDEFIYHLAKACLIICVVCDIDEFIIGGGISQADGLLNELETEFKKQSIAEYHDVVFKKAQYGNDAGIIGAVYYAKNGIGV